MASTVPRARKRYDSVELKPLSANADDDDDDDEPKGKMDQWLSYILAKLHALLWIVIAGAIAAYTQLFEVILDGHPPHAPKRELNRCASRAHFCATHAATNLAVALPLNVLVASSSTLAWLVSEVGFLSPRISSCTSSTS